MLPLEPEINLFIELTNIRHIESTCCKWIHEESITMLHVQLDS